MTDLKGGFHLGPGLELFPGLGPFGIGPGLRSHTLFQGDGFNTAKVGLVYRGF